jgi:hypothetical protein
MKSQSLYEESISYLFLLTPGDRSRDDSKVKVVHDLRYSTKKWG